LTFTLFGSILVPLGYSKEIAMVEERQEPEWLTSLREQQQEGVPRAAEGPQEPVGQPDVSGDQQGQMGRVDMVEGLREQFIQAEEEFAAEERESPLPSFILDLRPWQRLVLAVLLFLNVALCGCMGLVMAGRVVLP
jgi:hypothetical protein